MQRSAEMKRLDKDLAGSQELVDKLEAAAQAEIASGTCASDAEVLVKAAKALGYDLSIAELERLEAGREELDLEEMAQTAGGEAKDEHGREIWCVYSWHCFTVNKHTQSDSKKEACWINYTCLLNHEKFHLAD